MKLARRTATRTRHRDRRLLLEQLENRALLATFHVALSGSDGNTGGTADPYRSIQAAINAAGANADGADFVKVEAGAYDTAGVDLGLSIPSSANLQDLQLQGGYDVGSTFATRTPRSTVYAPQTSGAVNTQDVNVADANVTIDGFYFVFDGNGVGGTGGSRLSGGVLSNTTGFHFNDNAIEVGLGRTAGGARSLGVATTAADQTGLQITNNTITADGGTGAVFNDFAHGIFLNPDPVRTTDAIVSGNTITGTTLANGILVDTSGHVTITGNTIVRSGTGSAFNLALIGLRARSVIPALDDVTISQNTLDSAGRADSIAIHLADAGGTQAISGVLIDNNLIQNNTTGIVIGPGANQNNAISATINFNSFTGNVIAMFRSTLLAGSTTIDATRNWWDDITGPTTAANPGGAGQSINDTTGIDFQPWLVYSPDADSATAGVQLVTAFDVPAQTADFTSTNNNYRRLVNVIETIQPGQAASLSGTFDWTETSAAASWALGNDDLVGTGDDYSLLAPANVNSATITAAALGDAIIIGPGDLAAANLEGVFVFDGGDNQYWQISNLQIVDFDLAIGFFNGAGGSDAFNGTIIANNLIRIPADLNATVAPADVSQNIGIHYSFGINQIITSNVLHIVGSGVSDGSNFSSSVGMQSNTSGGDVYDGLLIDNNFLFVSDVLAAQPSNILGIWENGHAHTSDITVNNNRFHNQTGANSATNLMRAFRVTSHSSAATSVTYSDNVVDGANVGFQWLAGSNFAGNQPVRLLENVVVNSNTGVLVQSNGNVDLSRNTITGSGVSGVNITSGTLASATQNSISNNSNHGLELAVGVSAGPIFNNNLSGNAGLALNNASGALVDASGNWWGGNTLAAITAEISGNVDFTPWLDSGIDLSGTPGFQGDFNALHVDDNSEQAGATGRIGEGLNRLLGGGTLTIHSGIYVENVDVTTQGATLILGNGAASVEIDGNLALDSDDFLELDLGNNPGTTGDLLDVSGAVSLGNATATLSALEPLNAGNTLVVLKRGSGNDFFGNLAQLQQVTVDGNFVTARYDLPDGNDFGFVTQQNPSIGNAGGTLNYTENDPPTLIVPTATVSDLDNAVLNGGYLQVLISQNAEATDILAIRSVGSGPCQIQVVGDEVQYEGTTFGTISGGAGTPLVVDFTSDGNATLAAVQALARSITFESTSDNPATAKKVLFFIDDGTGGTGAINKNIAITVVNDAPVLDASLNPALTTIDEDATNPGGTFVSSLLAGAFSDPDGTGEGIAVTAASTFAGTWEYSFDGGASWTNMGGPSPAAALLLPDFALVRFIPDADFNGAVRLWYHAWDQTQGTAGGTLSVLGQPDSASTSAQWDRASLTVSPVNDRPVLDVSLNPTLNPTGEDALIPASTLVSNLLTGAVADVDDNALRGIAVTAAATFRGQWQYSLDGGSTYTSMGEPSPSAALLLPGWARVRFRPEADFHGTVRLWYHAWDQTEGTAGGTLSVQGQPDTASTSTQWESTELTVLPVNDAPVVTVGGAVGYVHDAPPIQLAPSATVTDVDSDDFDTGRLRVYITDGDSSSNRLAIGAGFTVDANDNVLKGSTIIGRRVSNGFGTNDLVVRFNANARPFITRQLIRAITFKTVNGAAGERKVVFNVKDGDGGLSAEAVKVVNVS